MTRAFLLCTILNPWLVFGAEIPSRQKQWKTTLETAKKEKKVYLYMYRYGKVGGTLSLPN